VVFGTSYTPRRVASRLFTVISPLPKPEGTRKKSPPGPPCGLSAMLRSFLPPPVVLPAQARPAYSCKHRADLPLSTAPRFLLFRDRRCASVIAAHIFAVITATDGITLCLGGERVCVSHRGKTERALYSVCAAEKSYSAL